MYIGESARLFSSKEETMSKRRDKGEGQMSLTFNAERIGGAQSDSRSEFKASATVLQFRQGLKQPQPAVRPQEKVLSRLLAEANRLKW
jgi:hypothetical protein